MKCKIKTIHVPIYEFKLTCLVFNKHEDLENTIYWDDLDDKNKNMDFSGLTLESRFQCKVIILIKKGHVDTLVHELVHVKNYISKFKDIQFDDESEAYFMEYIFNRFVEFIK